MVQAVSLVVLVVDNERLIRWAVAETLVTRGHVVIQAPDALTARRAFDPGSRPVDVALLDLRLPDSDDLGLLVEIRQRSPATAVIVMTAIDAGELLAAALGLGAHAVLGKPFDIAVIEPLVRSAHAARH